jgi:outer membrane receptor protein involved in Fe transport
MKLMPPRASGLFQGFSARATSVVASRSHVPYPRRRLGFAALLATGAFAASAALGQTASNVNSSTPPVLEEIVVTAQKRTESIQNVPMGVSVVGDEQLQQYHVTQLTDIGAYVPGLQVDSLGSPGQTQLTIRGIAPVSFNATVGTYIDDAPIGATSFHNRGGFFGLDLLPYDVQRIEVLEGPQGTLYGANSIGGLLKYVLTQPRLDGTTVQVGADALSVADSTGTGTGARAMLNTQLVPGALGLIASYAYEHTPGFTDNFQTGQMDQNALRQDSGRLALLWKIRDNVSLTLGAFYQHSSADGNATVALDPTTLEPLQGKLTDNNFLPNLFHEVLRYYSADLHWDLSWAKLVAVSSYSDQSIGLVQDNTLFIQGLIGALGGPVNDLSAFGNPLTNYKFTGEVRLSSPTDVALEWLVGVYYDHEDGTNIQTLTAQLADGRTDTSISPVLGVPLNPLLVASLPTLYKEYAGFGDLTYHITQRFDLSAGVRYAENKQAFTQIALPGTAFTALGVIAPGTFPGSSSQDVWTYSASPRFHFSPDVMGYIRVASGYQPGGPNTALPGVPSAVNASTLSNYEVGLKSELWHHRAALNVSGFDLEWKKIQVLGALPNGVAYNFNGGTARSRGFDAEGMVRPLKGLQLAATATYTDAVFTQAIPSETVISGSPLPFTPKWSGSFRAEYSHALVGDWNARVGGGLRLVGARYDSGISFVTGLTVADLFRVKSYTALDLNGGVGNSRYTVGLYVKNVTDKRAYLTIQNTSTGETEGTVLQPRTIGLSVDVKF